MNIVRILLTIATLAFAVAPVSAFAEGDAHGAAADHGDGHADAGHGDGHGDGHGEEHVSPAAGLIRHAVNLIILLAILFVALKTPTKDFLHFRRTQVKEQLDSSWQAKSDADATYAELQGRLDNFGAELASLMDAVRKDAATDRTRVMAQAERSAAQLEDAAKRTVEEELRRSRTELRNQTVELAVKLAEDMLSKSVDTTDQARLGTEYLARIEEAAR